MCQSSTPIRNMYNLHNILYQKVIQFNIETYMCWTEKKLLKQYFKDISWDIYMPIISQNKIYLYLRSVSAVCPMFQ